MVKKLSLLVILNLITALLFGQTGLVTGKVVDDVNLPLTKASIILLRQKDSSLVKSTVSAADGSFRLEGLEKGDYILTIGALDHSPYFSFFSLNNDTKEFNPVVMIRKSKNLQGVTVISKAPLATQRGDTTEYNANQFKVNPDASTEDLIKKMPGVTVDRSGTVTAQGEQVRNVTVDGKRFFGDDATAALRNLPAEIVDKIQVFDRLSEQAQFTGFDDGSGGKGMNIVTKSGMRNGQFGKLYGGYGTEDRYNAGGNMSFFKGERRLSLIGMANNINQQNFSMEDILGVTGSGGGRMGGSGNRGGGRMGGGFGGNSNFFVGQQNGISSTLAGGINYVDKWGKKAEVSFSYFNNYSKTNNDQLSNTIYRLSGGSEQFYDEQDLTRNNNSNHRFNGRVEFKLDSNNSIVFTPTLSLQDNESDNQTDGVRYLQRPDTLNSNQLTKPTSSNGYNSNNNLLYRHNFRKKGRTFSINLGVSMNTRDANSNLSSINQFIGFNPRVDSVYQLTEQATDGYSYSAGLNYTEPVGKAGQLQISYNPSYSKNTSNQEVNALDMVSKQYSLFDTVLSNKFDNLVTVHAAGFNYRKGDRDNLINIGFNLRYTELDNDQQFPQAFAISKYFSNVLPNINWRKKINSKNSLNFNYRSNANIPSINQLQNVVDNSNPLQLTTGNPDLKQQVNHNLTTRYTRTDAAKGTSFFANAFIQLASNYISNALLLPGRDSALVVNGYDVPRGAQISLPVNLKGYFSSRLFLTEAFPIKAIKCNLNLNAGGTWSRIPGLVNDSSNRTDNYTFNTGVVLSSNISERIDFNISYNAAFSNAISTLNNSLNTRYVNHSTGAQLNLLSKKGWFLQQEVSGQYYSGLSQGFNQSYWLWNASLGKKFLKNQMGELKLSVFDLLNQNQSITRNVTETYIEDVQNTVLRQYFMLSFSYKLRNFGTPPMQQKKEGEQRPWRMNGMQPGMF